MKTLFFSILLTIPGLSLTAEEAATPSRCVEEVFFGSSPDAYALLRTETEVTIPSGELRCRTWIDEYSKEPALLSKEDGKQSVEYLIKHSGYKSTLTQSTLLLDVVKAPRAEIEKDEESAAKGQRVDDQNTTVALAAMLLRYPNRSLVRWTPDGMKSVKAEGFFVSYKTQNLVNGATVRARMGDAGGDAEQIEALGNTQLISVDEDENCVYLTYASTNPKNKQTRIFCILPAARMNMRYLSDIEPFYLLAGRFDTKEEALSNAKTLRESLDKKTEAMDVGLQVWNVYHSSYSRDFYYVVLTKSEEIIRKERVKELEGFIGKRLPIVPSDTFSVMMENMPGLSK